MSFASWPACNPAYFCRIPTYYKYCTRYLKAGWHGKTVKFVYTKAIGCFYVKDCMKWLLSPLSFLIIASGFTCSLRASNGNSIPSGKKQAFVSAILNTKPYSEEQTSIITKVEWRELLLDRLLEVLDRTQTGFGPWGLRQLLHPIADHDELMRRQHIIKLLVEHEDLYNQIQHLLYRIHKTEDALLVYWYPHDTLRRDAKNLYFTIPKIKNVLNDSRLSLEHGVVAELFSSCSSLLTSLCLRGLWFEGLRWLLDDNYDFNFMRGVMSGIKEPLRQNSLSLYMLKEKGESELSYKMYWRSMIYGSAGDRYKVISEGYSFDPNTFKVLILNSIFKSIKSLSKIKDGENKIKFPGSKVLAAGISLLGIIAYDIKWVNDVRSVVKRLLFVHNTLNALQQRLVDVAQLFDTITKLQATLHDSESHFELLLKKLNYLVYPSARSCIGVLQANTFACNRSYIYSRGRVLQAHKRLYESKKDFIDMLQAIALIDSYYSIATLVKEYQTKPVSFTFPTFINQEIPLLAYEDAWIPLLPPEKVVTNRVYCGIDDYSPHMVITGPNGCGKSTLLKMIGQMMVLAQSWAIVPAKIASQTIYTGLRTGLDPHEDLQHGISTFMAEKKRMEQLHAFINASNAHEQALVLIDEPYRGTVDEESARRIYAFGKDIAENPYAIVCLATHVQKPIELPQATNGAFANYHVEILEPTYGVFKRTFKLKNGPATWWFEDADRRTRFVDWIGSGSDQELFGSILTSH